jgi:hypothetical protein
MVTRRELVTAGALGALASGGPGTHAVDAGLAAGGAQTPEIISAQALRDMVRELSGLRTLLRDALVGPSLATGPVVEARRQFQLFLRANQKYPDYCEIGSNVFTELYDWHVRHQQPIEITRVDNRMAIRFMFTWMVLRPEQDPEYVGIPFDRG